MKLIKKIKLSIITASFLFGFSSALADLTGTTVTDNSNTSGTVGGSVEIDYGAIKVDVSSNQITILGFGDGATFSQYTLTFSGGTTTSLDSVSFNSGSSTATITSGISASISGMVITISAGTVGTGGNLIWDVASTNTSNSNSDSTLTASAIVDESSMISIPSTANTLVEKVNIFDFTITDVGTSDGVSTDVTKIVINTSGTADFSKMKWLLSGNDLTDINGSYNSTTNTITFSDLNISVADGTNETYTLSTYFQNPTGLTDNTTFGFSINGSSDITVDTTKSTMAIGQSAITNSTNAKVDITATRIIFKTMPSN